MSASIDLYRDAQPHVSEVDLSNNSARAISHGEVRLPRPRARTTQEHRHPLLGLGARPGRCALHEASQQGCPSLAATQSGEGGTSEVLRCDESLLQDGIEKIRSSIRSHDNQCVDKCLMNAREADTIGAAHGGCISAPEHRDAGDGQLGFMRHHDHAGITRQRPASVTQGKVTADASSLAVREPENVAPRMFAEMRLPGCQDIRPADPRPIPARHASGRGARADSTTCEVLRRDDAPAPGRDRTQSLQVLVGVRHGEHPASPGPGASPTIHSLRLPPIGPDHVDGAAPDHQRADASLPRVGASLPGISHPVAESGQRRATKSAP